MAPKDFPVTFSACQLGSIEGWESGIDWNNANQLTTEIFYVQNSQNRGVSANYTQGPVSATVIFGDGYDSGVFAPPRRSCCFPAARTPPPATPAATARNT